jgi:hypothetical protein
MPFVLLKTGKMKEVPFEDMVTFLNENRDLIQNRQGKRKRKILTPELADSTSTK